MIPRILSNPFFIYIISFGCVIIVYLLGWSNLYPQLTFSVSFFLGVSFIVSFIFGFFFHFSGKLEYRRIFTYNKKIYIFLGLICLGYILELIYTGGVPLILVARGGDYDYRLFGIPTFHVLLATFNGFFSVYLFHILVSQYKIRFLFFYILSLIPSILIVNRGLFIMQLTASLFVYVISLRFIRFRVIVLVSILTLFLFYLFGILGNYRQTRGNATDSKYILEISKATPEFKESFVPDEFIWAYIYISSPLGNFQNEVNERKAELQSRQPHLFVTFELLPDFISKRIGQWMSWEKKENSLMAKWLNVGTFYASSFNYLGWLGPSLMFIFFLWTTIFFVLISKKKNEYYITGLAILNTVVLFNTFDNMYAFSGLSFQLVYPIILGSFKLPKMN